MNRISRTINESFLYSLSSGYNFYIQSRDQKYKIFGKDKTVIQHIKTGDYFYASELPAAMNKSFDLDYWVKLIQKPVDLKHFIWPVDIIEFGKENEIVKRALVFPLRALPVYENIINLLSDDMRLGWNVDWVKKFTEKLLNAWCNFSSSHYAYHEFSSENMFYQKNSFDVMFDFSFSTHHVDHLYDSHFVSYSRVTPDFADSFYYSNDSDRKMDLASDYYSIAVILFKLLIGRLPYQGTIMEPEPNTTPQEHTNWMRLYHKNPYFIFDVNDDTNHIGGETGFAKDEVFVERWNALPSHIRYMFHNVFQTANVLRKTSDLIFYSPKQWKDALFGEFKDIALNYRTISNDKLAHNETTNVKIEKPHATNKRTFTQDENHTYADNSNNLDIQERNKLILQLEYVITEIINKSKFYDVILKKSPSMRMVLAIQIIKELTDMSLADAKELVENLPAPIAQGISLDLALRIKNKLQAASVEVEFSANYSHNQEIETKIRTKIDSKGN